LANHQSAIKRARQNEIRRLRNQSVKTRIKTAIKKLLLAAGEKRSDDARSLLNEAKSIIDKGAKKRAIHPKTASRKISRLSKLVNSLKA
jgi:small subunit ribosomal protein S20